MDVPRPTYPRACSLTHQMTSRIHIGRPASATYNADPHGFANPRPAAGYRAANPDDPLEKVRAVGKQVEDTIEIYSQPLKPHLPTIGRFLIVVTFYEDALRITTQWKDQLWYLQTCVLLDYTPARAETFQTATGISIGVYRIYSFFSILLYVFPVPCPLLYNDHRVGHVIGFHGGNVETVHRICRPGTFVRRGCPGLWIWADFRSQFLPAQPERDRWSGYGV